MESYRSGHNGAHSKCVSPYGHEGSNPSDSALYFIVGTDEILDLERWYEAEKLMKEFAFIVGIRPGYGMETVEKKIEDLKKRFGADINVINLPAPDVSSTEIREAISEKKDLCGLVPERVNEYIKANRLYQ